MKYTKGERCSARCYDPTGFGHYYPCTRKAVVERDGKPYCKVHDPEYIGAKNAERTAKFNKRWAEKTAYAELQNTTIRACKQINPNNPMAVAEGISDLYKALRDLDEQLRGANLPFSQDMFDAKRRARQAIAKVEKG